MTVTLVLLRLLELGAFIFPAFLRELRHRVAVLGLYYLIHVAGVQQRYRDWKYGVRK